MKIASLLPSATEIVCLLGLEDDLVGVTHECDYPEGVKGKPVLTASNIEHRGKTGAEIDRHISEHLHAGSSIYRLDHDLLEELNPDLILTQELCAVCAVSYTEVQAAVKSMVGERRVLSLEPTTFGEILENIVQVGRIAGREQAAKEAVLALGQRVKRVAQAAAKVAYRPRVFFWEWLDPIYVGGHWIPGMIDLAGGTDGLGVSGAKSRVGAWEEVQDYQPEVIVLSPCGYNVEEVVERAREVSLPPWWNKLPAVGAGKVYAVNASAYFARPGPRIVDGLEILAQLLHPELNLRHLKADEALSIATPG